MRTRRHAAACAALAAIVVGAMPDEVHAQSADDVASRVGTVAREMGKVARSPWELTSTFTADVSRGNTDSKNLRSTLVYVKDSGRWRFGSYLSGALSTVDGRRNKERAGLNLALARRFSDRARLVLLQEIVRAPLDGLSARSLLGGMIVWTTAIGGRVEPSFYAGSGWASEVFSTERADANYAAGLAGATVSFSVSDTADLNVVASYTQDWGNPTNYKIGSSVALTASVNAVLGLQLSYALAYDHDPPGDRLRTNQAFSAGFTLGWRGQGEAERGG